ncbi:unnamed protein product [Boreogadus saida]
MLRASETSVVTTETINSLRRIGCALIRWMCNIKAREEVGSDSLLEKMLGIQDIDVVLRTNRLRRPGRLEKTWEEVVRLCGEDDYHESDRPHPRVRNNSGLDKIS